MRAWVACWLDLVPARFAACGPLLATVVIAVGYSARVWGLYFLSERLGAAIVSHCRLRGQRKPSGVLDRLTCCLRNGQRKPDTGCSWMGREVLMLGHVSHHRPAGP